MPTTLATTPHRAPKAALDAWNRALTDPSLRDLPFKLETTATGQYILTPAKLPHSRFQKRIAVLLEQLAEGSNLPAGEAATEVAVETSDGVKVADVAWVSDEIDRRRSQDAPALTEMPEIMIEVCSPGNSAAEIREKRELYLREGALEVWICEEDGRMRFHGPEGPLDRSALVPEFPASVARR